MQKLHRLAFTALFILFSLSNSFGQDGKINEVFDGKSSQVWVAKTKGSAAEVKNNKLVVTPAAQPDGSYRGDIGAGPLTLHAGKYPILAIKFKKTQESALTFDTNMGSYQGWKGGFTKIPATDGLDIYYIDISKKPFKRGNDENVTELSKTEPTTFKGVSFKIAGIQYKPEQVSANQTSYEVAWIKTFASVDELKASFK